MAEGERDVARTSELVDEQEPALFGHSLGLENMEHHSNSVFLMNVLNFFFCKFFAVLWTV